jgi:hypothetical protein
MVEADLFPETASLADQIRCAERELRKRRQVYPRFVADQRMTQAQAEHEIATMAAILETLRELFAASR